METEELTWPWWSAYTKDAELMYLCINVSVYQCIAHLKEQPGKDLRAHIALGILQARFF